MPLASSNRAKKDLKSSVSNSNEDDKEESNELDYNEDIDHLEEKKQEQETGEITIDKVF
jgi:hypothetical protein